MVHALPKSLRPPEMDAIYGDARVSDDGEVTPSQAGSLSAEHHAAISVGDEHRHRKTQPQPALGVSPTTLRSRGTGDAPDGRAVAFNVIDRLAAAAARGEKTAVILDIDNTLADTRLRTVAAAHAFGQAHGVEALRALTLDNAGLDGRATAINAGLGDGVLTDAFAKFWEKYFWAPENLRLDEPLVGPLEIATYAQEHGVEVVFLTGRIERYRGETERQLKRFGLNVETLLHKPTMKARTAPYKAQQLLRLLREGYDIGLFLTEGRRDLHYLQKEKFAEAFDHIATIHYDFPLDSHAGYPLAPGTPVLN